MRLFREIRGPYSFVTYKKSIRTIYWARDSLGRNSLLMGWYKDRLLYVSSVNGNCPRNKVVEVPPLGIYAYNLDLQTISLIPWTQEMFGVEYYQQRFEDVQQFMKDRINITWDKSISVVPPWLQTSECPRLSFRFDHLLEDFPHTNPELILTHLMSCPSVAETVQTFITLLSSSIFDRINHTPRICTNCRVGQLSCNHAKVGVLFSGGVDCSLLAVLADQLINAELPINLYNVAFEKVSKVPKEPNWNVPDRISALEALQELQKLNPNREWNLVEINVPRKKLDEALANQISHLVAPLTSVLDESLGGALWFASGGGIEKPSLDHCCRVLLIGSGADELLGGYTRHRNAYRRTGDVEDELLQDWHRLPSRNLARDDRVISDNGVTPRAPFVEEAFVSFIRKLHPMEKCYHKLAEGLGDKLLLRLAAFHLGLKETSYRRKRALQFGSRIADSRQNAKDKSQFLE